MTIRPDIKLPVDTVASVSAEGLLGGKFVKLEPGKGPEILADGGRSPIPRNTSRSRRWWVN